MFLVLILWLLPGDHHGAGVSDWLHRRYVFRVGRFSLVLVLDVGVKGRITQVGFSTCTYVISLSSLVSGPSLSLVLLDDGHLVALVVGLLLVHFGVVGCLGWDLIDYCRGILDLFSSIYLIYLFINYIQLIKH